MEKDLILGADVGGSHITVGLVNMQIGIVEHRSIVRKRVDSHASANEIITIWAAAINESAAFSQHAVTRVGIAMPGPFDYENGICLIKGFDKYEMLYGLNIKVLLAEQLGIKKEDIKLRNDAETFLEGELFGGAAKGFNKVICITLGTGLGSACSVDGITIEANLNVVPFKDATAEEYISTRWFIKRYLELTGKQLNNTKALADVFDSDKYAAIVFKEFGQNIAALLRPIIEKDKPEVIVLGGNISHAWHLFIPDVKHELGDLMKNTIIVKSQLGENAALIGGACCFLPNKKTVEKIYVDK